MEIAIVGATGNIGNLLCRTLLASGHKQRWPRGLAARRPARDFSGGLWSDRHGATERDATLAFSRASIDPGDMLPAGLSRNAVHKYLRLQGGDMSRAVLCERFASDLSAFSKVAIREESAPIWSR
jgi:hypothetical protein